MGARILSEEDSLGIESHPLPPDIRPKIVAQIPARLVEETYDELRALARRVLADWRSCHSFEATALVHESWLRISKQESFTDLGHKAFVALTALNIRRILVEEYHLRRTQRRGGAFERVPLLESKLLDALPAVDFLALDEALEHLAAIEPRQAQVVELRFFGGLSESEVAEVLEVAPRTVRLDWRFARAWLANRLKGEEAS